MRIAALLGAALIGCAPAPMQQTVEITPLPTHTASPSLATTPTSPPAPPRASGPDRDGDGVLDDFDECPDEPGPAPSGCPPP